MSPRTAWVLLCCLLVACQDPDPATLDPAPTGYLPYTSFTLDTAASAPLAPPSPSQALLAPAAMAWERGDQGQPLALYLAERNGWRILRYPVASTSPLTLAPPSVEVDVNPLTPEATWAPTGLPGAHTQDGFGDHMALGPGGELFFTGLDGDLWWARPGDPVARRIGAGLGGSPVSQEAPLSESDLRGLRGLAVDREQGVLLLVAGEALYALALEALEDPLATPVRVLGTGAYSPRLSEGAPREVNLSLRRGTALVVEGQDLYLLMSDAGQVVLVSDYLSDQAQVWVIAGGGSSLALEDPLEAALEFPVRPLLAVQGQGGRRELLFTNRTGLARLTLERARPTQGATLEALRADLLEPGALLFHPKGGFLWSRRQGGDVLWQEGEQVQWLLGQEAAEAVDEQGQPRVSRGLPVVAHPGAVLRHLVDGEPWLLAHDFGTGKVYRWSADRAPRLLVDRSSGADFARFDSLATTPQAGDIGPLVLLQSATDLLLYQPQSGQAQVISSAGRVEDADILQHWRPGELRAVGITSQGGALLWEPQAALLHRLLWFEAWGPQARRATLAGAQAAVLSTQEPNPLYSLPLGQARDLSLSPRDTLVTVLEDPRRGSLILAAPLRASEDLSVAGLPLSSRGALVVAGGGAAFAQEGAPVREVALAGVQSAAAVGGELWWIQAQAQGAALYRAGALGQIQRVSQESPAVEPAVGQAISLEALPVDQGARLLHRPCLGLGAVLLLGSQGAWWLQLAPGEAEAAVEPTQAGQARLLARGAYTGATCLDQGRLGLLAAGQSALDVVGEEARWPLGEPAQEIWRGAGGLLVARQQAASWALEASLEPLGAGAAPSWQSVTGLVGHPWDERSVQGARLADDGLVWTGAPDGALYGAGAGVLLRLLPAASGFSPDSALEILLEDEALEGASALTAGPGPGLRLFVASGGRVYRWAPGQPGLAPLAGGGALRPGLSSDPYRLDLGLVEGLLVDERGDLWLRGAGVVGRLRPGGAFQVALGGGERDLLHAQAPWQLRLAERVGAHPALAWDEEGALVTPAPEQGALIRLRLP